MENKDSIKAPRAPAQSAKGILCAKCEHLNPSGSNICSLCGGHLYVTCHRCGCRNPRVDSRCQQCGHRLHRSFWKHLRNKLIPERLKINWFQVVLLIVAVFIVYRLIVAIAERS
jgi:hypothetical protein